MPTKKKASLTGLDQADALWPRDLKGCRAGLVVHPASMDRTLRHAVAACTRSKKFKVTTLFGPQHGILGQTQDNMIEWEGFRDPATNLPVYSLYGNTRKPAPAMLDEHRRADHRPAGRGQPLLHLHLDPGPLHAGLP